MANSAQLLSTLSRLSPSTDSVNYGALAAKILLAEHLKKQTQATKDLVQTFSV